VQRGCSKKGLQRWAGCSFGALARACSRAERSHAVDGVRNDQTLLRATTGARVAHEAPRAALATSCCISITSTSAPQRARTSGASVPPPTREQTNLKDAVLGGGTRRLIAPPPGRCRPQKPKLDHLVEHDLDVAKNPRSAKLGAVAQTGSHGHGAHSVIDCLASA